MPVDQLIALVQLEEKRKARVGGLSGGQKQRLAMALALAGDPELVFLDEPTTGLDPQARRHLWELVEELKRTGRTIILTTHYMEEAERLCDRVAIMDRGRKIAEGTPKELIALAGGEEIVELGASRTANVPRLVAKLKAIDGVREHTELGGVHRLAVGELHRTTPRIFAVLEEEGVHLSEFRTHSATLEDVFVKLTGRNLRDE
jgi:ABC-2 type transport system ATP-binding protein